MDFINPTTGCQCLLPPPSPFALSSSQQSPKPYAGLGHFTGALLPTDQPTKTCATGRVFSTFASFFFSWSAVSLFTLRSSSLYFISQTASGNQVFPIALIAHEPASRDAHHCPSYVPATAIALSPSLLTLFLRLCLSSSSNLCLNAEMLDYWLNLTRFRLACSIFAFPPHINTGHKQGYLRPTLAPTHMASSSSISPSKSLGLMCSSQSSWLSSRSPGKPLDTQLSLTCVSLGFFRGYAPFAPHQLLVSTNSVLLICISIIQQPL